MSSDKKNSPISNYQINDELERYKNNSLMDDKTFSEQINRSTDKRDWKLTMKQIVFYKKITEIIEK